MALDQIWKQQLSLVTYGNEYLSHDLPFSRWLHHSIQFSQLAYTALASPAFSNLAGGFKETWGLPFKSAQFKFID